MRPANTFSDIQLSNSREESEHYELSLWKYIRHWIRRMREKELLQFVAAPFWDSSLFQMSGKGAGV